MKRLYRRTTHKKVGGVASGLADYFEIDPIITRALFIFGAFLAGSTILLYLVLWFMMPKDFEVYGYQGYGFQTNNSNNYNSNNYSANSNDSNLNNMAYTPAKGM